jgi:hypothetical protein
MNDFLGPSISFRTMFRKLRQICTCATSGSMGHCFCMWGLWLSEMTLHESGSCFRGSSGYRNDCTFLSFWSSFLLQSEAVGPTIGPDRAVRNKRLDLPVALEVRGCRSYVRLQSLATSVAWTTESLA